MGSSTPGYYMHDINFVFSFVFDRFPVWLAHHLRILAIFSCVELVTSLLGLVSVTKHCSITVDIFAEVSSLHVSPSCG